jgi:FHA domain-containing protein/regulatory LuxR family protein
MERHGSTPAELAERLAAERRGHPFLTYRDESGAQRLFEFAPETERVTLGRRAEADVALSWDDEVSRLHAVLESVAGEWTVVDDGLSQNGTFVGLTRIVGRHRLRDDDELRVGRTRLRFRNPVRSASRPTVAASPGQVVADISDAQRRVLIALCRPYADRDALAAPATNRQIADELFVTVDTVKTHLRALFEKFGLGDLPQNRKRAMLAERARTLGIVAERDLRAAAN